MTPRPSISILFCLALMLGCPTQGDDDDTTTSADDDDDATGDDDTTEEVDDDGDGSLGCEDCDDADGLTYPGAPEQCDGLDNDCDGEVDEDTGDDLDGDGFNPCGGDCDDGNAAVYPDAPEICDGLDSDCDGATGPDEVDDDADGFMVCEGDCDDADPALEVHNTNQDFYLQVLEDTVDLEVPIYVEVQGYMVDNDGLGAMVRDEGGALITAVSSNDYDGVNHNGGQEAIVEHATVPTGHYLGAYLLDIGDINDIYHDTRIGLYYDGSGLHYYLDGIWQDSVAGTIDLASAGLGCFACQGSPGAGFLHLWIGGAPIDFDPSAVTSDATAVLAAEQAF